MPTINAFPQRPRRDPPFEDEVEAWAMPLGRVGGVEFQLSYSVFVAFAVFAGMIAMVKGRDGNADLPIVAMIGTAFWVTGWLVQIVSHCFMRLVGGIPIESLTIGLRGIESRTRSWSAKSAFIVATATILSIVVLGGMFLLAESIVLGPRTWDTVFVVWGAPGFGLGSRESVWLAGAWLCLIQAVCQVFPLPKSLGRLWLVSGVAHFSSETDEAAQTRITRKLLNVIAVVTALAALATIASEPGLVIPRWPLLLLLSLLLWFSARGPDLFDMLIGFGSNVSNDDSVASLNERENSGLMSRARQSMQSAVLQRRARKALVQERSEAQDAQRLDQVLQQLHDQGLESLSSEDRALLQRVSQTLREHRSGDAASNPDDLT